MATRVDGNPEEDVVVPLPEEQDEYSRLHPYPCDFCSRRFSKKSGLTMHMLSHQIERPHECNLCGASYSRKAELVEHMKIHAYAPIKTEEEEEEEEDEGKEFQREVARMRKDLSKDEVR
uniref:C2H2-type domain-containing protein n=1 Tax=Rhodnius prolixus TaxID=13249 RepID=T1HIR8_RHOPR